jgi:ArsR family metal-binding transcriptional regulator
MLLTGYKKEISRPECNPNFQSLHCIAHLDDDIGSVLPYLNAELGGHQYTPDPPSVTFKSQGRLITLHPRKIAINALESAEQAEKILEWLKIQINEIWARRDEIEPSYKPAPTPTLLGILKLLPRTNCKVCGQPTCLVFATQIMEGGKSPEDCPNLRQDEQKELQDYLSKFNFGY